MSGHPTVVKRRCQLSAAGGRVDRMNRRGTMCAVSIAEAWPARGRPFGVQSYWIVDPEPRLPSLTAFELRDGRHAPLARVAGGEILRARRPFGVEVVPARRLAGVPGRARD